MDLTALLLSRIQFASTISLHIIFPAFTVGLAAWLSLLEAMSMATSRPVYRRLFDFWRSIFAVAFAMGGGRAPWQMRKPRISYRLARPIRKRTAQRGRDH